MKGNLISVLHEIGNSDQTRDNGAGGGGVNQKKASKGGCPA